MMPHMVYFGIYFPFLSLDVRGFRKVNAATLVAHNERAVGQ